MKITRENYMEFGLDYLEGNLSIANKELFEKFLLLNPDLKEELNGLEEVKLSNPEPIPSDIFGLKIPSDKINWEERLLELFEGDLSPDKAAETKTAIESSPALKREWEILTLTRLETEEEVIYPDKQQLYKKPVSAVVIPFFRYASAVAAVGLMLFLLQPVVHDDPQHFAEKPEKENSVSDKIPQTPDEPEKENIEPIQDESSTIPQDETLPIPSASNKSEIPIVQEEAEQENSLPVNSTEKPATEELKEIPLMVALEQESLPVNLEKEELKQIIQEPGISAPEIAFVPEEKTVNENVVPLDTWLVKKAQQKITGKENPEKVNVWDIAENLFSKKESKKKNSDMADEELLTFSVSLGPVSFEKIRGK